MNESMSIPGGPVGVRIPAALLTAERLTEAQLDGHACVVCGLDYLTELTPTPHMPVGTVEGGQVFACSVPCAAPVGVVHKVLLPIRGAVVGLCGAKKGKAVAISREATCPDCLALIEERAARLARMDAEEVDDEPVVVRPASPGKTYAIPAPPVVEEVELIRADDLAVVEIVRAAGVAPAVRFSAEGRVDTWTPRRALIAAGLLINTAKEEAAEEVDEEDADWLAEAVLGVALALIRAARLVRDEIKAA